MKSRWQPALLAIVLALFSWYLVSGRERVETWIKLPVEMNNPPTGLIIISGMVDTVEARVRGPKGLVRSLSSKDIPFELDLSGLKPGENHYEVNPEALPLSNAYEVMEVKPNLINLYADRLADKRVSVSPVIKGEPLPDFKLGEVTVEPTDVHLKGPERILNEVEALPTLAVTLPEEDVDPFSKVVELDLPLEVEAQPARVTVTCTFVEKTRKMWVKIPLQERIPTGVEAKVAQHFVRLHLECPVSFFRIPDFRDEIGVEAAIPPSLDKGKYELDFLADLPEGCSIIESKPQKLDVVVSKNSLKPTQSTVQPAENI